jgi:hypothetical protein
MGMLKNASIQPKEDGTLFIHPVHPDMLNLVEELQNEMAYKAAKSLDALIDATKKPIKVTVSEYADYASFSDIFTSEGAEKPLQVLAGESCSLC